MIFTTANHTRPTPSAATLAWAAQVRSALQQRSARLAPAALGDRTSASLIAFRPVLSVGSTGARSGL